MIGQRRDFLKKTASFSLFSLFSISSLINAKQAYGKWLRNNFSAGSYESVFKQLFNDADITDTKKIKLKLPKTAENGAIVPVEIKSKLENINKVYILIEKNPVPLAAEFRLSPDVDVYIKARLKIAESCDVIVVAVGDEGLYRTRKPVKVTIGGCGG